MPTNRATGSAGFTLIEVLVALAVVVVAFLAMYGSAQQIVLSTTVQQDRTFASWVAIDQLTELRLADRLPQGDRISGETEMAGREWRYVIEFNDVDSNYIRQAIVRVSPVEQPDLVLAESLAVLQITPGGPSGSTGRPPGGSGGLLQTSAGGGGSLPGGSSGNASNATAGGQQGNFGGIDPGIVDEDVAGNDPGTGVTQ